MKSVAFHTLAWLLQMSLMCNSLPIVDPGLFVIMGVRSCRSGAGYCLLGLDCTLDEDFLPDDEGGHCDGLRSAFTPSAHFICCRYNAINKTNSVGHDMPDNDLAHLGEDPPVEPTSFSPLETSTFPGSSATPDLTSTISDHISTSSDDLIYRRDDLAEINTSILPVEIDLFTTEPSIHETTIQTEETSEPIEISTDSSLKNRPIQPRVDLEEPTMTVLTDAGIIKSFPSRVNAEIELKVNDNKNYSSVLKSVDGEVTTIGGVTMETTHYRTEISVSAVTKSVSRRDTVSNLFDVEEETSTISSVTENTDLSRGADGTTVRSFYEPEESTTIIDHTEVEIHEGETTITTDINSDKVTEPNNPTNESPDEVKLKEDFDNYLTPTTTERAKSTTKASTIAADNDIDNNTILRNVNSDNRKNPVISESSHTSTLNVSPAVSEKVPETNNIEPIISETTTVSSPTNFFSESMLTEKATPSNSGSTLTINLPSQDSGVPSTLRTSTESEASVTFKIKSDDTSRSSNDPTDSTTNSSEASTVLSTESEKSSDSESSTLGDKILFTTMRNYIDDEKDNSSVTIHQLLELDETLKVIETSDPGPQSRYGDSDLAESKTETPENKMSGDKIQTELTVNPSESDVSKNTIPPGTTQDTTFTSTRYPSSFSTTTSSTTTLSVTKNPFSLPTTENSENISSEIPETSEVPNANTTHTSPEDSVNANSLNSSQESVGNNSETRCGEFTAEGKDCWLVRFMDPDANSSPMCIGSYVDARTIVTSANCVGRMFDLGMTKVVLLSSGGAVTPPTMIRDVMVHEEYRNKGSEVLLNDIGIVRLLSHSKMPPAGCALCLPKSDRDLLDTPCQDPKTHSTEGFDNEIGSPMVCRGGILAGVTSSHNPDPVYTPIGDYLSWIRTNQKLEQHPDGAWK